MFGYKMVKKSDLDRLKVAVFVTELTEISRKALDDLKGDCNEENEKERQKVLQECADLERNNLHIMTSIANDILKG